MATLYRLSTAIFWLLVALAGGAALFAPAPPEAPAVSPATRGVTPAELAAHATEEDCWMAIRGGVYDVSAYLPEHPTRPQVVLPWCGREATEAYATKLRGRPHSPEADRLLETWRIGSLAAP